MINLTAKVIFHCDGPALNRNIRLALKHASDALRKGYELEYLDLDNVTTKNNQILIFSKFVELVVLKHQKELGRAYVDNAFSGSQLPDSIPESTFNGFLSQETDLKFFYKETYGKYTKKGLGLFLISLHSAGAITLPMNFRWPVARGNENTNFAGNIVCEKSEILSFIRSLETKNGKPQDSAFDKLSYKQSRTQWFSTNATRVVLATGWNRPEDAKIEALFLLRSAQRTEALGSESIKLAGRSVFASLIEILNEKYGPRLNKDFSDLSTWKMRMTMVSTQRRIETKSANAYSSGNSKGENQSELCDISPELPVIGLRIDKAMMPSNESFIRLAICPPSIAYPERLADSISNAVGDFDFSGQLNYWIELEQSYIKNVKKESYKGVRLALGTLNLYLFYYLPHWYIENVETEIPFPSTPNKLIGSIFVSRLIEPRFIVPLTLLDFMRARELRVDLCANSAYGSMKQVEMFFDFIERNKHRLPDSGKFIQPFSKNDYPTVQRSKGTNKVPIPRRFLTQFISYVETIRFYVEYVWKKRINGELTDQDIINLTRFSTFVDTVANGNVIGMCPVIFGSNSKETCMKFLPAFPTVDWHAFGNGQCGLVPHPHSLNQIAVAIFTGLRHNHIQWLDAKKFDSAVASEISDYAELFINTDKKSKKPWFAYVNFEVIEILRSQLAWRNAISAKGFNDPKFYNNNPQTAYPKFLPLFSSSDDGLPHSDNAYTKTWQELILGFQSVLAETVDVNRESIPQLCKLLPAGIDFYDEDAANKYKIFDRKGITSVPLRIVSEITPHSCRALVVSEYIRFLPAEVIGRHITGQKEGTVYHYVVLDNDEMKKDQLHQAMDMRNRARDTKVPFIHDPSSTNTPYIKADSVNSKLAKSMRRNVPEAIARYGCISLSVLETGNGLDVLNEMGVNSAAFNKTEICPFGNNCPDQIIKQLKGLRRCAICPYAVRSVDHLPAICSRQKQAAEILISLDKKMAAGEASNTYTGDELDALEGERQRLGEELAGWELSIEILELARRRLAAGQDSREWIVEKPEILIQQLQRVATSTKDPEYLLIRLNECIAYPGFQSPEISRKFDLLRRQILAKAGTSLEDVLTLEAVIDPAAECAGLIRSLAATHELTLEDVVEILTTKKHVESVGRRKTLRLTIEKTGEKN